MKKILLSCLLLFSFVLAKSQPDAFPEAVFTKSSYGDLFEYHIVHFDILLIPDNAKKIITYYNCLAASLNQSASESSNNEDNMQSSLCVSLELEMDGSIKKVIYENVEILYRKNQDKYTIGKTIGKVLKRDTLGFYVQEDSIWKFNRITPNFDRIKLKNMFSMDISHDYRNENPSYPVFNTDTTSSYVKTCYFAHSDKKELVESWHNDLFAFLCNKNLNIRYKDVYKDRILSCQRGANISALKFIHRSILNDSSGSPKAIYETGFEEAWYYSEVSTCTTNQQNLIKIEQQYSDTGLLRKKQIKGSLNFNITKTDEYKNWIIREQGNLEYYDIRGIEYW
jgi:hypothetical protein